MESTRPSSGQRVLLVDDDPIIVATTSDGLRRAGFDVTATTNVTDALEQVAKKPFALAIVDYAMPDQNGLEVAASLTKLRQPFMFLSAYCDEDLVSQAVLAGALAYVVKPIDPTKLVPLVRAAIQRAQEITALLDQTERLTKTVETRRDVSVAVGLVMAYRGVTRRVAYEAIRQHARRSRRKVPEVAAEITSGAEALYGLPVDPSGDPLPPDELQNGDDAA